MDAATSLLALGPALVALALVDSLSVGTLAVPVWLMLAPGRPRAQRILLYLFVLAVFYFLVGLVLLGGANALVTSSDIDWGSPAAMRVLFFVGAALLAASFVVDPPRGSKGRRGSTRLARWRAAATGTDDTDEGRGGHRNAGVGAQTRRQAPTRSLVGLALAVGLIEVGTMLPYLAAVGLVTSSERPLAAKLVMLAGYCVVMVLPALLLLAGRKVAARMLDPLLRRVDRWFNDHGSEAMGWILGIVGVVLMGRNLPAVMDLVNGI